MRIQMISMMALALCLVACGKQQPPVAEPSVTAPDEASEGVSEAAEQQEQARTIVDQALIEHMHEHAEKIDELMFALADEDLDGAQAPANWLGGHQSPDGIPADWQPYLTGMREAAIGVELATDLESARAAAEQISVHCQGCHAAAGIVGTE